MLHFFKRGTRFGRALIFSALVLLVGIIFSVINPFYNLSDLLGWSNAASTATLINQSPSANVSSGIVPMPACKGADGPCAVQANAPGAIKGNAPAGAVIIATGQMPANAIYRKVKPSPFGGMLWSSFVNVFFAIWVICAIIGCYILVQETLNLVTNHFRSREEALPLPHD